MDDPYRCKETIDLEEIIDMSNTENATTFTATAIYKSGREEVFSGKLSKGGVIPARDAKKISALRSFPTVVSMEVDKK